MCILDFSRLCLCMYLCDVKGLKLINECVVGPESDQLGKSAFYCCICHMCAVSLYLLPHKILKVCLSTLVQSVAQEHADSVC